MSIRKSTICWLTVLQFVIVGVCVVVLSFNFGCDATRSWYINEAIRAGVGRYSPETGEFVFVNRDVDEVR